MVRDDEVERSVRERGQVLGTSKHRHRCEGLVGKLRIVAPEVGLRQAVNIPNPGSRRNAKWSVKSADFDPVAL